MQTLSEIPIVLTATIVPNKVNSAIGDPEVRKAEYLRGMDFYSRFAKKIFFLENSSYPIQREPAFSQNEKLILCKLPTSSDPTRGKGFQEFEMLDHWIKSEASPPERWLKISGRYLIRNIAAILEECAHETRCSLVIDQAARSRIARTQAFFTTSEYYEEVIKGIYSACDDHSKNWIERVLFQRLAQIEKTDYRFFRNRPQLIASSGATGASYPSNIVAGTLKQLLRTGNRLFDPQYLWFSR